jgi:hypothetical protein
MLRRREFLSLAAAAAAPAPPEIEDRLRGGWLGQLIAGLNGLQYEMKFIQAPGDVEDYRPGLPEGAWTDDDTDIEWVYAVEMERTGELFLPYPAIAALWKKHINRRIWSSHLYLRQLLDLGLDPPLTGKTALNPWAGFNLSGQFVAETWGLISPDLPRTAARLAVHYTSVSIEGEPSQAAQMIAAMIAVAYSAPNLETVLEAGKAALDPRSILARVHSDVLRWHADNPRDWRTTRESIRKTYAWYGGHDMRDRNGVVLNGAATLAALLHGRGDFIETVRLAFNFGWDCDNNAAAVGAILGVMRGAKWFAAQGWPVRDVYRNTSRDGMPEDETITRFGDRLAALMRMNLARHGGRAEKPANVERLADLDREPARLRSALRGVIARDLTLGVAPADHARAAYLAICLDLADELAREHPKPWARGVAALGQARGLMQALFKQSPIPQAEQLRRKLAAAGVPAPEA